MMDALVPLPVTIRWFECGVLGVAFRAGFLRWWGSFLFFIYYFNIIIELLNEILTRYHDLTTSKVGKQAGLVTKSELLALIILYNSPNSPHSPPSNKAIIQYIIPSYSSKKEPP